MLDPLTALSLAGNIVQFVDFSTKLLAKGHELYKSADGTSVGYSELEAIAKDLQELNDCLKQPTPSQQADSKSSTNSEAALRRLSEQCSGVAGELVNALDKLKVQGTSNRHWKSFRQALKCLMKKEEVDAITARLQHFRDELNLHVLVTMRDTLDMQVIRQTEGFRSLSEAARDLVTTIEQGQKQLQQVLTDHTERINAGQVVTNELITAEHERTRRTILASMQSGQASILPPKPFNGSEASDDAEQNEKGRLIETLLLSSLRFPTMTNRYDEIEPAHLKTYEWIFRPPDPKNSLWADFPTWLTAGKGIYWINGKAASGKSTLMRFVCNNQRTMRLLNEWSQGHKPVMSTYFFWNSGTKDQRSHSGLLRALLFDILHQNKHLIPSVFPRQWAESQKLPARMVAESSPESWTLSKLSKAFELLFQEASEGIKFCLFIDGLDEYDGEPLDIINLFAKIAKRPNLKICLSSRPLYDFVKAFRSFPTLRLQDLTFNDIKQYVDDELGANDQMQELQRREPEEAPNLVLEIIDKADGVFLWVKLVVLSLLRGLRNSDHVSDLQKRLRLLPPSLEELFSHILGRVEPVYQQQSARIIQIFSASLNFEHRLTSLELSFAEEHNAQNLLLSRTKIMLDQELVSRRDLAEIWLLTRCGGLIESHNNSMGNELNRHLSYLHRTVRDFLALPQIWSRILKPTIGTDFNPHRSLFQSTVLNLKFNLCPRHPFSYNATDRFGALDSTTFALKYAYQTELDTGRAEVPMLDELDRVSNEYLEGSVPTPYCWATRAIYETSKEEQAVVKNHDSFLALAIRAGLSHYVAERIKQEPDVVRKKCSRPLLEYGVAQFPGLSFELRLSSKIIDLLFRHGACPNQIYDVVSAWQIVLQRISFANPAHPIESQCEIFDPEEAEEDLPELLKVVRLFLQNGAVINQMTYDAISANFNNRFPKETKELQDIMKTVGGLKEPLPATVESPLRKKSRKVRRTFSLSSSQSALTEDIMLWSSSINSYESTYRPPLQDQELVGSKEIEDLKDTNDSAASPARQHAGTSPALSRASHEAVEGGILSMKDLKEKTVEIGSAQISQGRRRKWLHKLMHSSPARPTTRGTKR